VQTIHLESLNDFAEWRGIARSLLMTGTRPDEIVWHEPAASDDLFARHRPAPSQPANRRVGVVPQRFIQLAEAAICHRDPARFGLLYRLLFRLQKDSTLLSVFDDVDVGKLNRRVSAVRRDAHRMTAVLRFRRVRSASDRKRFAAWCEPDHYILERTAPFFARRLAGMDWAIFTPYRSAFCDGEVVTFGPGASKADALVEEALDDAWRNLPEAEVISHLTRNARAMEQEMPSKQATAPPQRGLRREGRRAHDVETVAEIVSLADARADVQGCRRCELYKYATQAVFGEGPSHADLMFVGEQPGDQEDLQGRPFVGPAGKVFDAALAEAGIDRRRSYVTNAVKHFKFTPRGKRRIHNKPDRGEIAACQFWLNLEREFVKPKVIVALGATAITGILGKTATITSLRGDPIAFEDGSVLFATVHPSYLLRVEPGDREAETRKFTDDLRAIRKHLERLEAGAKRSA
jgi:DNA polymerase